MKRILNFLLLLFVFGFQARGQMEARKMSTGVNIGGRFYNDERSKQTTPKDLDWSLNGDINQEYFVSRNASLILGLGLGYSSDIYKTYRTNSLGNEYLFERNLKTQSLSPWLGYRKYWFTENGKFAFVVMPYGRVNYTHRDIIYFYNDPSLPSGPQRIMEATENWSVDLNVDIIVSYFITPNFSIELSNGFFYGDIIRNRQSFRLQPILVKQIGLRYYY